MLEVRRPPRVGPARPERLGPRLPTFPATLAASRLPGGVAIAMLAWGAAACAPAATAGAGEGGRTEEAVATRASAPEEEGKDAAIVPLDDAQAVHGTIDPATGRRTSEPAVSGELQEPVRTEIQSGRLRQADPEYQSESGVLPTGYRVQVMATPDFAVASAEATRVKDRLGRRYPVYVEFIDPYYKVRVGDFVSQVAAQPAVAEIRRLGYADAWAVHTTVKRSEP